MSINVSPEQAVQELILGNQRFVSGCKVLPRSDKEHREKLAEHGQTPFVAVLACADSRVPVEKIFDMGFGDIFTIRVAGNVIGPDQLGSLEYAVDHLGVSLIVILGHTDCGAINGAIASLAMKVKKKQKTHVNKLLQKMAPMVQELKNDHPHLSHEELSRLSVTNNIWHNIKILLEESAHLREVVAEGKLMIYGAVYDLADGRVHMLGPHRRQDDIIANNPTPDPVLEEATGA